ncbi:uncharacterized [Tachysurus ichikawai]
MNGWNASMTAGPKKEDTCKVRGTVDMKTTIPLTRKQQLVTHYAKFNKRKQEFENLQQNGNTNEHRDEVLYQVQLS